MTVIHHDFGGASALPPPLARLRTNGFAGGRPDCPITVAARAHRWIDEAVEARKGLTPQERRTLALSHTFEIERALKSPDALLQMGFVGRHAWIARILMTED